MGKGVRRSVCAITLLAFIVVLLRGGDGWNDPATHYDALGVRPDATSAAIRKAFRERAKTVHPDKSSNALGSEEATRRFNFLSAASEVLGDEASRAQYDQQLAEARRARAAVSESRWAHVTARIQNRGAAFAVALMLSALGAVALAIEYGIARWVLRASGAFAIACSAAALVLALLRRAAPRVGVNADSVLRWARHGVYDAPLAAAAAALAVGAFVDAAWRSGGARRGSAAAHRRQRPDAEARELRARAAEAALRRRAAVAPPDPPLLPAASSISVLR